MTTNAPAGRTTTLGVPERTEPARSARERMPDADYADAFRIASAGSAPAGAWARRAFEGGPALVGTVFRALAWRGVLGMHLGPVPAPGYVAGWSVVVDEPEVLVMHVDSWMLTGRLVTEVTPSGATITTLLRFDRRPARAVWAVAGNLHRALLPRALRGAAQSIARGAPGATSPVS